jgi:hypothetical protein
MPCATARAEASPSGASRSAPSTRIWLGVPVAVAVMAGLALLVYALDRRSPCDLGSDDDARAPG